MPDPDPTQVTHLLDRLRDGDDHAADQLLGLVYEHLRGIAGAMFVSDGGHTLQPTALVHEAWIKLAGGMDRFESRRHFFAVAAKAMRQVLADHSKARKAQKRGGAQTIVQLAEDQVTAPVSDVDLVALDETLTELAQLNERHARVVELRLLGALTIAETAATLGVSPGTVKADWTIARAWLAQRLAEG